MIENFPLLCLIIAGLYVLGLILRSFYREFRRAQAEKIQEIPEEAWDQWPEADGEGIILEDDKDE
jgi:hypothetical protein